MVNKFLKTSLFSLLLILPLIYLSKISSILTPNKHLNASFIEFPEFKEFKGKLLQNDLLTNAKYIGHEKLRGAETIIFSQTGQMFSGLLNGQIVRIDLEKNEIYKIVQIGDEIDQKICNDYGLDVHAHKSCGRPLGLRFKANDSNCLYVVDAYYGLFKVDVSKGTKKLLLSSNDKRFGDIPLKMVNDLDIDGDIIYLIDSSYGRDINEALDECIECQPRGRLFSFNERTNKLEQLLDGLYFPNGLQLMPNKEAILINECSTGKITKFYLNGEEKGLKETFANIPGLGDTIRLTDQKTLLVPIAMTRRGKYSFLPDVMGRFPSIRSFIGSFINIRQLMLTFKVLPKYGLLVEYDLNGNIIKSWHDPSGKVVEDTANAVIHNNKIYIGSFHSDFIAVIDY